ncbi:MAG: DUF922 domain-containing Zn-dependent protease [Oscillatoriales cyanobacterium SM2_2_1]|nr:DUF922 domain-containing Zn-dependent protease [Oscillatoriales cyanobacterium SM2_2_1]
MNRWQKHLGLGLIVVFAIWLLQNPGGLAKDHSSPRIAIATVTYPVYGTTISAIRQSMTDNSPIVDRGNRFDGFTRWNINWRYSYSPVDGVCRVNPRDVSVTAKVTFTMPKWQDAKRSSPAVGDRWNRFIRALQRHEDGHRDHGIRASQDIFRALQRVVIPSDCGGMQETANATARAIIARYNQADLDYDRRTGHGRTQGAQFP